MISQKQFDFDATWTAHAIWPSEPYGPEKKSKLKKNPRWQKAII